MSHKLTKMNEQTNILCARTKILINKTERLFFVKAER